MGSVASFVHVELLARPPGGLFVKRRANALFPLLATIGGVAPFAVRNTNDGMVASLNSPFVNNNQVGCPDGTQLVAGICAETALRQNGGQVQYTAAFNECLGAGRGLPSNGESALIAQALTAPAFGTGNWTDDTAVNGANQTGSIMLPIGFHVQIAQTDLVQFRCVTSPISPKPPTPAS